MLTARRGAAPVPSLFRTREAEMNTKLIVAIGTLTAMALVVFAARPQGATSTADAAHLVSMPASAQALHSASDSMQRHGQWMFSTGQQTGDEGLNSHGMSWGSDGQAMVEHGRLMADQ